MPPVAEEARLMASQADTLWHPKRVAIVHSQDAYGGVLSGALRQALPPRSPVVLDTPFVETQDTVIVAALERTIRAANPDMLFWLGPPRVLGTLVARMREHLPELRIMGSDKIEGKRIYDNADGIFSGLVFVRAADPNVDTARYNDFQYRFSMWQGGQGTSEALLAYDAASMVIQALRDGAVSRQQIHDYMLALGHTRPAYRGITGPIVFDSTGVLRRSLGMAEVRDDGVKAIPLR
jgi:branched-chain amino acid transport system substrate-binding protein